MRLLVIVNCYTPDQRVSARRWGGLVAELQRRGVECTVISAGDGSFSEAEGVAGEHIIRLPISNRAQAGGEAARAPGARLRLMVKGVLRYFVPLFIRGRNRRAWRDALQQHTAVAEAAKDCNVIVASYGPMAPLLIGHDLALMYKKPLVIDIRDSFQAKEGSAFPLSRWISRYLEKRVLAKACSRITIGRKLAQYVTNHYQLDFHAIYNGWNDEDIVTQPSNVWEADEKESPYLYYAGTIYPHRQEALSVVLRALESIDELRLRIRVLSDNTEHWLENLIKSHCLADRVDLLPPVPSTVVAEEMAASRGVLVLENLEPSELHDGTVTGKLFGLLASGIPGIAISSPTGEIREIIQGIEGWHGVSTEAECVQAIRALAASEGRSVDEITIAAYHVSAQADQLHSLLQNCRERDESGAS